jgi:FMN phosphatase YigB (HAD superfamily)
MVSRLHVLVDGAVTPEQIARDLIDGARTYARWRDDSRRADAAAELSHQQVFGDFVAAAWPKKAKAAVLREATSLAYAWTWRPDWRVRSGIPEVLRTAVDAGLLLAVVSNTFCGAAHRDFLANVSLSSLLAVQHYSDEAGTRKPNPDMAHQAARDLGLAIEHCWFVGDSLNRDIACARRARAGAAILMRSFRTDREGTLPGVVPDATVNDGFGLQAILNATLSSVQP